MMRLTAKEGSFAAAAEVYGRAPRIGLHALAAAVNEMYAAGAETFCVSARFQYAAGEPKTVVYQMEKVLRAACRDRGIELAQTRYSADLLLRVPRVTVLAAGQKCQEITAELRQSEQAAVRDCQEAAAGFEQKCQEESAQDCQEVTAGSKQSEQAEAARDAADIVLLGRIGTDGMLQAARERREELEGRFAPAFLRQIFSHEEELFAGREILAARRQGAFWIRQITEGGVFAALWELAGENGVGFEADLKRIRLLQETVEVCEHFGLNPYQLTSAGSFLLLAADGEKLVKELAEEGVCAAVIGHTHAGRDKIIRNGEEARCLDRPAPDERYRIYDGEKS